MALPLSVVIRIPHQLNLITAPFLWADLEQKMQAGTSVVLDMARTKSIDDNGLRILQKAQVRAKLVDAQFKCIAMNASIKTRMAISGVACLD